MDKQSKENLFRGIIRENPTFVMMLGMCPTLGVTTSATNGLGIGLATMLVLILSNITISAVKNFIPDTVRIPCFIVIAASLTTVVDMLMAAYFPSLYNSLGIFIPLIAVNCIILGRAEAFASSNNILQSTYDAIGMGLGFTFAVTLLGLIREVLGNGSIFDYKFLSEESSTALVFIMPPGAFLALAGMIAVVNIMRNKASSFAWRRKVYKLKQQVGRSK